MHGTLARRVLLGLALGLAVIALGRVDLSAQPSCGNGIIDPGEDCDPPGSITCPPGSPAGAFLPCNPDCTCGSPGGAFDHFKCYVVRGRGFARRDVSLVDQFESKSTTVLIPKLLCNPVNKNGEGVPNPDGHLTCYKIRDVSGQTPFVPRSVTIRDQFAQQDFRTMSGDCRQSAYLCVPSLKEEL